MRAQALIPDFVFGVLILVIAIGLYETHMYATENSMRSNINELVTDIKMVSSSIMSSGYPANWTSQDIDRLGITNDDSIVDRSKFRELANFPYDKARGIFGTRFEWAAYFVDSQGYVINIEARCSLGHSLVTSSINKTTTMIAYYMGDGQILKEEMHDLGADIYEETATDPWTIGDASALFANISSNYSRYRLVVMEEPELGDLGLGDEYIRNTLHTYADLGSTIILGGDVGMDILGANFTERATADTAKVVSEPYMFDMEPDDIVSFAESHVMNTTEMMLWQVIANYSDASLGVSRWEFGRGEVYHFSSFEDTNSYFINTTVYDGALLIGADKCTPIEAPREVKNVLTTSRIVGYKNRILRLVLFIWET